MIWNGGIEVSLRQSGERVDSCRVASGHMGWLGGRRSGIGRDDLYPRELWSEASQNLLRGLACASHKFVSDGTVQMEIRAEPHGRHEKGDHRRVQSPLNHRLSRRRDGEPQLTYVGNTVYPYPVRSATARVSQNSWTMDDDRHGCDHARSPVGRDPGMPDGLGGASGDLPVEGIHERVADPWCNLPAEG